MMEPEVQVISLITYSVYLEAFNKKAQCYSTLRTFGYNSEMFLNGSFIFFLNVIGTCTLMTQIAHVVKVSFYCAILVKYCQVDVKQIKVDYLQREGSCCYVQQVLVSLL